jgi:hypothetical protein
MKPATKGNLLLAFLIAVSYTLGRMMHPAWLFIMGLIGVNVLQSALTGFSPEQKMFKASPKPAKEED